ncbi:hypothetical protein GOBAR_AA34710 [Gossypium barbadense]|uniref:Uncharacterized protein n=1 Tax=Gossypium barbadense TaxID=3634 RepID=A0A2P5W4I2_GOSBA|nr:hypothetical protein GOBAR_AA34710 [Gossypium barbadense]
MKLNEDNNNGCLETYVVSLPTPKEAVSCRNYTHLTATRTNVALQQARFVYMETSRSRPFKDCQQAETRLQDGGHARGGTGEACGRGDTSEAYAIGGTHFPKP